MGKSDFELVIECINSNPGRTGREIATLLRRQGHERFTSKLANQTLYRLLTAELVTRDASGDKPRWYPGTQWTVSSPEATTRSPQVKRPLDARDVQSKTYIIASTQVKVLLDESASPNDPYITPDWVGSHVIVSINTQHPFWEIRLSSSSDRAMYSMISAIDAYVQWKVAQLHEPPDATEVQKMRDYALRFCTLLEAETINSD